ncbi:MAG: iron-sulfur cluster assembly accessory protein [Schleiferiaceae bacterium]
MANAFIRVGVKSGGCSGLSYDMGFVNAPEEGDQLFEDQGVKILVEKKSLLYLLGTTLEYSGGLNGKGFEFNNPNASRTCGCGESFSL